MTTCAVTSCTEEIRKAENIATYHKFPNDVELFKKWLVLCGCDDGVTNSSNSKLLVCARHFKESDYERNFKSESRGISSNLLKSNSLPNSNLMKIKEEPITVKEWDNHSLPVIQSLAEVEDVKWWKKLDSCDVNNAANEEETNPHENEHLREINQVEQRGLPAVAPVQEQISPTVSDIQHAPSSLPASQTWPGEYGFTVSFSPQSKNTKGVAWTYSKIKDKLYVGKDAPCPINFSANAVLHGATVRVMALYTSPEQVSEVVQRCWNHSMKESLNKVFEAEHLVRCDSPMASYDKDSTTERHSVIVPFENPPAGQQFSTYIYKFACFGSCAGGPNRRPLMLIFTLEKGNQVIGRRKLDVKICACPGRDRKTEESQCVGTENTQRVTVKRKEPEEFGTLADALNFTKSVYCPPPKKSKLMPSRDGYYTISVETQECYEFLMHMKHFYEMCKRVSGLSPEVMRTFHHHFQRKKQREE